MALQMKDFSTETDQNIVINLEHRQDITQKDVMFL